MLGHKYETAPVRVGRGHTSLAVGSSLSLRAFVIRWVLRIVALVVVSILSFSLTFTAIVLYDMLPRILG